QKFESTKRGVELSAQNLSSGRAMVLIENGARCELKPTINKLLSPLKRTWTIRKGNLFPGGLCQE
ncbi:hypothetical protein, partial [Nostoc sp.]|uniref:hypothetical protein n=1 Tax=Nostoc sp. TaxID=1180 RepID=UPI002FFD01A2